VRQFLPFIVVGLTAGSVYGIAGMGLVLTYKTSGVFNFAHGAVAAIGAYVFYSLHVQHGLAWPLALAVCLGVAAPLAGLALERIARLLAGSTATSRIVASVGLLLAIQGGATVIYGAQIRSFPQFLPRSTFSVGGTSVGWDQLTVMVVAAGSALGLFLFFRRTRLGLAMQAVVDDPDLLALSAVDPKMTRRSAWIIGCMFAALSGVLIAPTLGLDAFFLTLLVVQAFGGAAIGRFSNLPMTYAGGLIVGVAGAVSQKYAPTVDVLRGLPPSVPFIVLFAALLLYKRGSFVETGATRRLFATEPEPWPRWTKQTLAGALVVALLFVPSLVGPDLPVYTNGVTFVMVFLALGLLVWTSGQISLCQAAFAAVGATAFSHLTHGLGLPWIPALFLAGLCAVPVGALIAIPSIRLSGVYLALATFGFGILMERMAFATGLMFGGNGSRPVPRPDLWFVHADSDRAFYYVALAVTVACAGFVLLLVRSRLGRLMRAVGDAPVALDTLGTSVMAVRVLVFCISAFLTAVAGGLFGSASGAISGNAFGAFQSLLWLTVLALAGSAVVPSAVAAAFALAVLPRYITFGEGVQPLLFGILAVTITLLRGRYDWRAWLRRRTDLDAERRRTSMGARWRDTGGHNPLRGRHSLPSLTLASEDG
jgi:branched-subunit amino acid ABC-type transport system permease component